MAKAREYQKTPKAKEKHRAWKEANREKQNDLQRRRRAKNPDKWENERLQRFYGISLDEYKSLALKQGLGCAICGSTKSGIPGRKLVVDHDHLTGKVRGLLCSGCNSGLGGFKDSIKNLDSAKAYLGELCI